MKKTVLVACFAVFAALFVSAVLADEAAKEETIQGKVVCVAKDDDGNATKVAIDTGKGKVAVADNEKGKELLKMVDKTVKATGTIAGEGDAKTITVTKVEEVKAE